ncbi:hypothetical protein BLOT_010084 [Blomia tropicalis]|nr:hypothetical protein BLOT_010084 [Blomia tropicalis]
MALFIVMEIIKFQETPETSVLLQKEAYSLSKSDIEVQRYNSIIGIVFYYNTEMEQALKSHFGLIVEYLTSKYQLTETTSKQVKQAQAQDKIEKIKQKRMHRILFENEKRYVDFL